MDVYIDFYIGGKSAYEIWLDQGNIGTPQDFLNSTNGAVRYDIVQSLTDEEKAQALQNIGGGTGGGSSTAAGAVVYNATQVLTTAQMVQARQNIQALGLGDFPTSILFRDKMRNSFHIPITAGTVVSSIYATIAGYDAPGAIVAIVVSDASGTLFDSSEIDNILTLDLFKQYAADDQIDISVTGGLANVTITQFNMDEAATPGGGGGSGLDAGAVRFDSAQALQEAEKTTARNNIGAAAQADMTIVSQLANDTQNSLADVQYDVDTVKNKYVSSFNKATGDVTVDFSTYALTSDLEAMAKNYMPKGAIIMWSGAITAIPAGYALCDGSTVSGVTTPNLSGRFIVGYDASDPDYNAPAKTGGLKSVILTILQLAKHHHNAGIAQNSTDPISVYSRNITDPGAATRSVQSAAGDQRAQSYTSDTGGDQPHENRPPYFVLAYIIKVI